MPSVIYTQENPIQYPLIHDGYDLIVLDVDNPDGGSAVLIATNTGHILISKGRTIANGYDILQLMGHLGTVTNEGTLRTTSGDGAAIRFAVSAADHTVNNMGTIDAGGGGILFMQGGAHIVNNVGTITAGGLVIWAMSTATGSSMPARCGRRPLADAVLMDLGDGHDFYNGLMGKALGGVINSGSATTPPMAEWKRRRFPAAQATISSMAAPTVIQPIIPRRLAE